MQENAFENVVSQSGGHFVQGEMSHSRADAQSVYELNIMNEYNIHDDNP